jgi:DNA-binding MarR family transcriptional regulator
MSNETPYEPIIESSDMEKRIDAFRKDSERILIRLVTTISRICTMHASKSTNRFEMSVSQTIVMGELFRHNGCRQEDLRTFVTLDKGNVTRALQRLEENGLVERTQDPIDRRVVRVYVTNKALSIEREMYKLAVIWEEKLTDGFTPEERETLLSLLVRMEVNARSMTKDGGLEEICA